MIVDALRQFEQVQNVLPSLIILVPPILGITLSQASKTKATILVNNLPKEELQELKMEAQGAVIREENARKGFGDLTLEVIEQASLAQLVLTKITGASRRREKTINLKKRR